MPKKKTKRQVVNPGWEYFRRYTFSPAVRKGNLLFISGIDAAERDPATGEARAKGDIVAQTRVIYEKMKAILGAAGASFDDVVQTTDYIITTENYKDTAQVRREYFKGDFPAATGFVVKELLGKGSLIEIDAIAVLD